MYHRKVVADINLSALENNFYQIKSLIKSSVKILASIKANAYGHGSVKIAKKLEDLGIDMFGVACFYEAKELRESGVKTPILNMASVFFDDISYIFDYDCDVTIYSYEVAYGISQEAIKRNKFVNIHIKINIGMNRIGVDPSDFIDLYNKISNLKNINIRGIFAHFSAADEIYNEVTVNQIKIFKDCIENIKKNNPDIIIHAANSAATIYWKDSHFDMVRVGIALYGYDPADTGNLPSKINLIPIMTLRTFISQLRVVDENVSISYSNKYLTSRKSLIATIPIGYGDGFRRSPYNFSFVMINKNRAKIVGNVCMDQAMIDVTEIEGLKVGDEVIIMGERDGNNIEAKNIANAIKSSIYELLTSISQRVTRIYYDKL